MSILPVIVGYGGVNPAGRSSFDQGYRRMVLENLAQAEQDKTIVGLACMMKLVSWNGSAYEDGDGKALSIREISTRYTAEVCDKTLIRRIESNHYDPDAAFCQKTLVTDSSAEGMTFRTKKKSLPDDIPESWEVIYGEKGAVEVTIKGQQEWRIPTTRNMSVKAAGQLPTGFEPGELYNSRFQPRGLQLALFGATDAVRSIGIDWQTICDAVQPDETGVYASSAMGQLADEGLGGLMASRQLGGRPTSKQVPMGLTSMPADFVNAYVLGNLGHTESVAGACASFLYNLRAATHDIRSGARRVAVVGCGEAPILPEIMEGYTNMTALATEAEMQALGDGDPRRYSRPFGENAGFVMGESAQYIVLMDDALAIELGADIFGAVPDVHVDADGIKKSISGPGPGNYISFGKAVATARNILGEEAVRERSFVMAHGSSTPQNRVTESIIFERIAEAFGISDWPVCAVKAFVGHSLAPASGDQIMAAIGAMRHGLLPGIKTLDAVADDVYQQRLHFPLQDLPAEKDIAFINAKGFGGNNATGVLFSGRVVEQMLAKRYSGEWRDYCQRREATRQQAADYEVRADRGELAPIYRFGEGVIADEEVLISDQAISLPGYGKPVPLKGKNPYDDML
ncbi:beta-ketoacyl synthase [Gammaproteobacteria bacterium 53_120_T64]|nr:beta-ketoacyl synthase [Gammaproteobacteria bacterium 53_120_T64]